MSWLERQWQLKLEMLESLSRSQRAVAAMLESMAKTTSAYRMDSAEVIVHELSSIAKYQQALARHMLDIRLHTVHRGKPTPPWISDRYGICPGPPLCRKKMKLSKGSLANPCAGKSVRKLSH